MWAPNGTEIFGVDHWNPQASHPELVNEYANLCYACNSCNSRKGSVALPQTLFDEPLANHVTFYGDGEVKPLTAEGSFLIELLKLDSEVLLGWRKLWVEIWRKVYAQVNEGRETPLQRHFGFPDNLPDLGKLQPKENTRPEGIDGSALRRRLRGELPTSY